MSQPNQQPDENHPVSNSARSEIPEESDQPVILSFLKDLPNIITLLGLASGFLGIYFALTGNFPAAMIALLWAVLLDWFDGIVARRMPGRSDDTRLFGAKVDSLVDVITMAVGPAIVLLSYAEFNIWFFPGALIIVVAGAVRLAYFDVYGVNQDGTIAGLSLDITPLILALLFLFEGLLTHDTFAAILYILIVLLSSLHVAPFRMRKMVGGWYPVLIAYVLVLTAVYSITLLTA